MFDSNQQLIVPFFTRGGHIGSDVSYLSQSYFYVPIRTLRKKQYYLFQQTLKIVEQLNKDIAGFDMSYEELKHLCTKTFNEKQKV